MVSPDSNQVSRVWFYSGANPDKLYILTGLSPFTVILSRIFVIYPFVFTTGPTTPQLKTTVWAFPLSLAATKGISLISFPLLT